MHAKLILIGSALFLALSPTASRASVQFSVVGVTDPLNNTALVTLTYVGHSYSSATLIIEACNLSGWETCLTAIALNNPFPGPGVPKLTSITLGDVTGTTKDDGGWTAKFDPNAIKTPGNYGLFDIASITGKNFNGGNVREGIAVNSTGRFELLLQGIGLNIDSDIAEAGFAQAANNADEILAVRFQQTGPDGEGSDIGMGEVIIPEASSFATWGLLVVSLGYFVCRRGRFDCLL